MNTIKVKPTSIYFLFVFALFISHLFFVFLNQEVWPWDQAWYGEEAFRAWNVLMTNPLGYFHFLVHQFGIKAPLLSWVSQVFIPIAKLFKNPHIILLSVVSTGVLSFAFLSKAFQSSQKKMGMALLFVASMPLFFGLQREFFVEPLQFFSVSIFIFLAYQGEKLPFWSLFFYSLFAAMVGLGAKVSTPLYECIWCLQVFLLLRKKIQKKHMGKLLTLSHMLMLSFSVLILCWYAENLLKLIQFLKEVSSGSVALQYGHATTFLVKWKFWFEYLVDGVWGGRFHFMSGLAFFLMVACAFIFKKEKKIIYIAIAQIILPLVVFSFQINEETRYLLPVLPSVAVLYFESLPCKKRWASFLLILLSAFRFLELNLVTSHFIDNRFKTNWITSFKHEKNELERIQDIIDWVCSSSRPVAIIGVDVPSLNCNTLNFYTSTQSMYSKKECTFHSLGYASSSVENSMRYMMSFSPKFFITYDDDHLKTVGDVFNQTSRGVKSEIEKMDEWHQGKEFKGLISFESSK